MVEFCGWDMPIFYPTGIVEEHLATRKGAGLFDVSHMGRFILRDAGALKFLQHVLSNNAEALNIIATGAQYTIIPTETGGAVDDAYLYRFVEEEYLLVVNDRPDRRNSNAFAPGAQVASDSGPDYRIRFAP
jgi:aminomethyltransferase